MTGAGGSTVVDPDTPAPVATATGTPSGPGWRRRWDSERARTVLVLLAGLAGWEIVGRLRLVADGALPAPSAIVASFVTNAGLYPPHVLATLGAAAGGFLVGNAVAIVLAVLFVLVPALERLTGLLLVTLFCLPIVVVAPILGLALPGDWPKIALAALCVFFPTMVSTLVGLRQAPTDAVTVVRVSGGGALRVLFGVRLPAALPDLLTGLQVAAPSAVLGAILGEFLGGTKGLGVYLLGSMGRADPATLWAIGLTAAALAAVAYGALGLVIRRIAPHRQQTVTDMAAGLASPTGRPRTRWGAFGRAHPAVARLGWGVASVGFAYLCWHLFIVATGLPTVVMNTPERVWTSLFGAPTSARVRSEIGAALAESLPPMAVGAVAGVLVAFALAAVTSLYPAAARSFLPAAFLSQTMPIVALTPLIALIFGRGPLTIVVVTVSVTFFPAFVAILQGIRASPVGPVLVLRTVGAGRTRILFTAVLPAALPHLFAAVRLTVPRALTGVVLAEQFVTGTGLGGLLGSARGHLDYRMIWVVAVVVAAVSVLLYLAADAAEHRLRRRFS